MQLLLCESSARGGCALTLALHSQTSIDTRQVGIEPFAVCQMPLLLSSPSTGDVHVMEEEILRFYRIAAAAAATAGAAGIDAAAVASEAGVTAAASSGAEL